MSAKSRTKRARRRARLDRRASVLRSQNDAAIARRRQMEATDASRAFGYGSEIAMMVHAMGRAIWPDGPASEVHLAIVKENAPPA